MSKLASYLVTGNPDLAMIQFRNGGIVCLDKENEVDGWIIKWTLFPN
ncbi:MAG: hypothetical protein R6V55_09645 [Desulfovermiculus sp.]